MVQLLCSHENLTVQSEIITTSDFFVSTGIGHKPKSQKLYVRTIFTA